MKKVIIFIMCLLFLAGCGKKDEGVSGVITLDINPSFEINIDDGKVDKIVELTEGKSDLVKTGIKGRTLDEVFEEIVTNAKEKGYMENNTLTIILGMEDKDDRIEEALKDACSKNKISVDIIVPKITEDAKNEAQGYGVTPAKAAVILEALKDTEGLQFDDLKDKSARELSEMKDTGLYCDRDYTLRGDKCEKAIKEEKPQEGKTCPETYQEIKGKCYKIGPTNHEPTCKKGAELKDGKCVAIETVAATAKCSSGTYNSKTKKCEVLTYAGEGTKKCGGDNPKISQKGTCTYPKPPIDGGCPGNDELIDGWCYNMIDGGDQYPSVTCPSGQTVKDGKCYTVTSSAATYSCSKGTLEGSDCKIETDKEIVLKVTCAKGLTAYKDRACIDYKATADYIKGFICPSNARLEDDKCVYYDVVDANAK